MALKERFSHLLVFIAALLVVAAPHTTEAQTLPVEGLIEMLPAGPIIGDGETPATLHLLMLKADGAPMAGDARFRIIVSSGAATALEEVGSGIFRFQYTPPKITQERQALIRLKGRSASGAPVNHNWSLDLLPPASKALDVTINPTRVVLGQDTGASLSFHIPAYSNAQGDAEILVRASSGEISNVTHLGEGRFTARYTPPKVVYPHIDLITAADARSPETTFGYLAVPLVGKVAYPVQSSPNAMVILQVGDRPFGPFQTDENGRASVPIEVEPGVTQGVLSTVIAGKTTEDPLDLKVPITRRISLMPNHVGFPGDGTTVIPVRAVVNTPTGSPDPKAGVRFSATAGTVGETTHLGNGVYEAQYTTPRMSATSQMSIQVSIDGEPGIQTDSAEFNLVPVRAAKISLSADPPVLSPTTSAFKLFTRAEDETGSGLAGRTLQFNAGGASQHGGTKDLQGGDYQSTFKTTGNNSVSLTATLMPAPTGNAQQGVVVISSRPRMPADNLSSAVITVLAVDAFGYPIPGVKVNLNVSGAGGTLPDSVTTNNLGMKQVIFTAGGQTGLAVIQANSGGFSGGTAIFLGESSLVPDLVLPQSGTARIQDWNQSWSGNITQLEIPREGADGLGPIGTFSGGTDVISTIEVAAQPASAAPGGTVTLKISTKNAEGRGLSGQKIAVMASQGEVGVLQELGGGRYQVSLLMPGSARDDTKIVISTEDGATFQMLTIPLVQGAPEPATPVVTPESATPEATATPVAQPQAPAEPKGEGLAGLPWLRLQGGFVVGQYTYSQARELVEPNPLYELDIDLENAPIQGGVIGAEAWLPNLPNFGAEARAQMAVYAAEWPNSDRIADWVPYVSVMGKARYGFSDAGNTYFAAASVGMVYGDFITYTYDDLTQKQFVSFGPLAVSSPAVGVELGGEFDMGLHVRAGVLGGFRPSVDDNGLNLGGYNSSVNLDALGMNGLLVQAGYRFFSRGIDVVGDQTLVKIGRLEDQSRTITLGVGYEL